MKVLHLLTTGGTGGIEVLLRNYLQYSKHEHYFHFLWGGGAIAEDIKLTGVHVAISGIDTEGTVTVLRRLVRFCKEEKIDEVIAHHASPLLRLILLYIKMVVPGIIIIAYAHGDARDMCESNRKKGLRLRRLVHRIVFEKADGIVAISNSVKDSLVQYLGVKEEKISVIYNGVPLTGATCLRETLQKVRLVYVGRLVEIKGIQIILDALAGILDQQSFEFDIIGEGPYRETLEKMIVQLGLESKARLVGLRRDVPQALSEKDIFIHMPICDEGFGITVVEGMAAGCICVCAAKGGIPEIIRDGVDGYLVQSGTAEELTEKLNKLIPTYLAGGCQSVSNEAIIRAKKFSIQNYSNNVDDFITVMKTHR